MHVFRLTLFASLSIFTLLESLSLAGGGGGSTLLSGSITASSATTHTIQFRWGLTKSMAPGQAPLVIPSGESGLLNFTIGFTRDILVDNHDQSPVVGSVCVKNEGFTPTQGLSIDIAIQRYQGGVYENVGFLKVPVLQELAIGESRCFPYEINAVLDPQNTYRANAFVSIKNYLGHPGTWGIHLTSPVQFTTETRTLRARARLTDEIHCPIGFTCSYQAPGGDLDEPGSVQYQVRLENQSALCGTSYTLQNIANLAESDDGETRDISTVLAIFTGTCRSP